MPRYKFEVGHAQRQCELCDIDLPGPDAARAYAILFVSELFRQQTELYWDKWHLCSVKVWSPSDLIFDATVPRAAMMERDLARRFLSPMVDH